MGRPKTTREDPEGGGAAVGGAGSDTTDRGLVSCMLKGAPEGDAATAEAGTTLKVEWYCRFLAG